MRTFEDFTPGLVLDYGGYEVSRAEIIAFAKEFDPQPFHLDDAAANASLLGGLSASGWHTSAILMRMSCDGFVLDSASMGGPGVDEVRWAKPVQPGDVLHARAFVRDARVSRSRPQMGLVGMELAAMNQRGETVMTQTMTMLMGTRSPPSEAAKPAIPAAPVAPPVETVSDGAQTGFFEDVAIGAVTAHGSYAFTAQNIVGFAKRFDPQPFHLSEEGARASHFGRLAASGWHTGAAFMARLIRTRQARDAALHARGLKPVTGGPSPGFKNLRWIAPVHAGDTISYFSTVARKRLTSRPAWGLVFSDVIGLDQNGRMVFAFEACGFTPTRG